MYYLQSRYYNPEWGRFINADAIGGQVGELLGHNIFAYCKNNPITMFDENGYRSTPVYDDYEYENVSNDDSSIFSATNVIIAAVVGGALIILYQIQR